MSSLCRIVPFSHTYLAEVLQAGDTAIDLTAGNGHDTLFLGQCVGKEGRVFSFDLQEQAVHNTEQRLKEAGFHCSCHKMPFAEPAAGVHLINASHDLLAQYINQPVSAIIANLGYLPGGDRQIVTHPDTTICALQQSVQLLKVGGRLAVVTYPSHPEGITETEVVNRFFANLDPLAWDALNLKILNRPDSPSLLVAEKK